MFQKILIALLIISTNQAFAAPNVPVNVVNVRHSQTSEEFAQSSLSTALQKLEPVLKVKFSVVRSYTINDALEDNSIERQIPRLYAWRNFARRILGLKNYDRLTIFLLPPLEKDGVDYGAGAATGICKLGSNMFAYGIVRQANRLGEDRSMQAVSTIEHEILHLFGASHVPNSIMDIGQLTLIFTSPYTAFNVAEQTYRETKRCISRKKALIR